MDVRIMVSAEDQLAALESLQEWLVDDGELRGRVTGHESPPPPGALGPVLDSLLLALAPGSVATALATALISWIRHRGGAVRIEIDLPDGRRVKLEADRVRELTDAQVRAHVVDLVAVLTSDASAPVGTDVVAPPASRTGVDGPPATHG
ncbi:effector-associated constant component EACC1 [Micromonospora sp. DT53]|uniref:effector-associated constant component EACC1 n=1 Tax=Micromonospora sp. DT53 TaxID=3393444 RepID=UPI003CEE2CB6